MTSPSPRILDVTRRGPDCLILRLDATHDSESLASEVLQSADQHHVRRVLVDWAGGPSPSSRMLSQFRLIQEGLSRRQGQLKLAGVGKTGDKASHSISTYPNLAAAIFETRRSGNPQSE